MNATTETPTAITVPDHDAQLVDLWLHGRCQGTTDAYRLEVRRFGVFTGKPFAAVTLVDVQAFADSLAHLAPASRCRALAAVKSLFAFGHRLGLLPVDVAHALRLPTQRDSLSERILPETDVHRMLALKVNPRNHCLLRLLYASGCRVSELAGYAGATWPSAKTAARSPSGVRAARPGLSACRRPCGRSCSHFAAKPAPMLRYSARGITAASSRACRSSASSPRPPGVQASRETLARTGCAIATAHTRSTAAPRSIWYRQPSDMRTSRQRERLHARPTEKLEPGIWPSKTAVSAEHQRNPRTARSRLTPAHPDATTGHCGDTPAGLSQKRGPYAAPRRVAGNRRRPRQRNAPRGGAWAAMATAQRSYRAGAMS